MYSVSLSIREQASAFSADPGWDARLQKWQDSAGRDYGFGLEKDGTYWLRVHNVGTFTFGLGGSAVEGFPDEEVDLASFRDAFFHGVAPWILQRREWDFLHGSAVRTGHGVIAFCGPAERGKSTLAAAWTERGAALYADDAVPFLLRDGMILAARLPQRLRLREPALSWFRDLGGRNGSAAVSREISHDLEPTLEPLRAVFWLEDPAPGGNAVANIEPIAPANAFPLLLSQAHCMSLDDPACNQKMVGNYLSLTRLAPVWRLSILPGRENLPVVIDRLERHLQPAIP